MLVAGFEPFGGDAMNPSAEIARALDGREIGGCGVRGAVLPCAFGDAVAELRRLLRAHQPVLVIGVGQAGGRDAITPERVAINVDDARIPDNRGRQPIDRPVVAGGPAAYWSTLPIKAIVAALQARGVPAAVSQTAGTFVCNHAFYGLMHALRRRKGVRGGFVHVPWADEQGKRGQPGLPLATMTEAIATVVEVAVTTRRDRRTGGGQTH
ncbi:pyroglutamyl-peptidase I [Horticoccus luteus]|uniref:Pyrrolidone-carboxylate peptidase n=1 Tax=Horticoccus luteus TaxID=2862869 RepID=A0A8F9TW17_9BACT|nr:pyroglutamyl-peptidase I [Horticoccus luteus]